tara:strand:- start:3237 stop:3716 length:480 start_codon:yes stop_codon:yes gene_type:complete
MQVILAYRKNGCLVGICNMPVWEENGANSFAHLISPIKLGGPLREIYVVSCNITDEDDLADIEDLVLDIGGMKAGFQAAELAKHWWPEEWTLENAEPLEVALQGEEPDPDIPYLKDGVLTCSVCGEPNCPWMEAPPAPDPPAPENQPPAPEPEQANEAA